MMSKGGEQRTDPTTAISMLFLAPYFLTQVCFRIRQRADTIHQYSIQFCSG